jgi:hypothetical protein
LCFFIFLCLCDQCHLCRFSRFFLFSFLSVLFPLFLPLLLFDFTRWKT